MRAADVVMPIVEPMPHPPANLVTEHLMIALEKLPTAAYTYDDEDPDVTWDDTTPERVWDAPFIGEGMYDVVCDWIAATITAGHVDEEFLVEAGQAVVTLDNRSGEYSLLDATGRLVFYAMGRKMQIFGDADGSYWWLFSGRVASWDENPDGTVTITAYDGFSQLAQEVTNAWTPGTASQTVAQRLTSIASQWSYTDPTLFASSATLLGNPSTKRSPLEEMQVTAQSDGGFLFCDADGRLTYRDRVWTTGRSDQTRIWTFSDNLCEGEIQPVWELEILSTDDALASTVRLENYEATPKIASAALAPNLWAIPYVFTYSEPGLWMSQADGNRLATDLLAVYSNDAVRFGWLMYLHTPSFDIWRTGIDIRLGDLVNIVRRYTFAGGQVGTIDIDAIVTGIEHEITPEGWLTRIETSRAVAFRQGTLWDASPYTWDDEDPLNVWRY